VEGVQIVNYIVENVEIAKLVRDAIFANLVIFLLTPIAGVVKNH
jgi:hypothetical protein